MSSLHGKRDKMIDGLIDHNTNQVHPITLEISQLFDAYSNN